MIEYVKGNLFDHLYLDALVNPVNCVGVMGAGLAKEFKSRYEDNFNSYNKACRMGDLIPGRSFVFHNKSNPKYIINFPTKRHFKDSSRIKDIDRGLDDLSSIIMELGIQSLGIPAIGCGLGGLSWSDVKSLILSHLGPLNCKILVFDPEA